VSHVGEGERRGEGRGGGEGRRGEGRRGETEGQGLKYPLVRLGTIWLVKVI
jgi:hypothetical protein